MICAACANRSAHLGDHADDGHLAGNLCPTQAMLTLALPLSTCLKHPLEHRGGHRGRRRCSSSGAAAVCARALLLGRQQRQRWCLASAIVLAPHDTQACIDQGTSLAQPQYHQPVLTWRLSRAATRCSGWLHGVDWHAAAAENRIGGRSVFFCANCAFCHLLHALRLVLQAVHSPSCVAWVVGLASWPQEHCSAPARVSVVSLLSSLPHRLV